MQTIDLTGKTILVTGSPGFIGANLVLRLLREMSSGRIISLDNMNDYYEPKLKEYRLSLIEETAKNCQRTMTLQVIGNWWRCSLGMCQ